MTTLAEGAVGCDDKMENGVGKMRRGIILVGGLLTSFCALWLFCTQLSTAGYDKKPVLSVLPAEQPQPVEDLQFPFAIPGTTLIAERIVSYDGWFAEGDEGRDVVNCAALLLYNCGEYGIDSGEVVLEAGTVRFEFSVSTLPAGERLLVPEKKGLEYGPEQFSSCNGTQVSQQGEWSENRIGLEYPDMGSVVVTNLSDQILNEIYLYYKAYLPETCFYVGGNTGIAFVERLEPGQSICIYPYNYALGYSRFVRVKVG